MRYKKKKYILWGLGLSEQEANELQAAAGSKFMLRTWPEGEFPHFTDDVDSPPCLISFSINSLRVFATHPIEQIRHLDLVPKLLVLQENATPEQIEEGIELGVSDIIRMPITAKRMVNTLRKATEIASLSHDIVNMTREVLLERELLERKNEILGFLVNFLSTTTDHQNEEAEILRSAFAGLNRLFPVLSLHAALDHETDDGNIQADLFISVPKASPEYHKWHSLLLENLQQQTPHKRFDPTTTQLLLPGQIKQSFDPNEGHILTLPLTNGMEQIGVILLLTSMERSLNRDQTMALDSAVRHLALSIKNARRFQKVRQQADSDGLTGFHNRRHFETVLAQEIERHNRYSLPMSLIMLDIDHFKNVNDTWGHMAGDNALRSIAATIGKTIRKADYCARFGGEEFVLLLPHTDIHNATLLAERLRRRIEAQQICHEDITFSITASFGVASLNTIERKAGGQLLQEADNAMYQAKAHGRNAVVVYTEDTIVQDAIA